MTDALDELLDLAGETRARRIVAELAGPSAVAHLDRLVAWRLAARMLTERVPRPVIRDRLMARGLSERSAYRCIEIALDLQEPISATKPGTVAGKEDSIRATHQPEQPMAATPNKFQPQLDAARARLAAIDLAAAKQHADEARAAAMAVSDFAAPGGGLGPGVTPELDQRRQDFERRAAEASRLKAAHRALVDEVRSLEAEIARLTPLAAGEEAVQRAEADLAAAQQETDEAQRVVNGAQSTLQQLVAMIAAEEAAAQADRQAAAQKLLAAVKSGEQAPKVGSASRDKLATLEAAKVDAERELEEARAVLSAARSKADRISQTLLAARANVAEAAFLQVQEDYIARLCEVYVAKNLARAQGFSVIDARSTAMEMARRVIEQGAPA